MKAWELIEILSEDPEREVMIALGSFRVASLRSAKESSFVDTLSEPAVPSFTLYPENYKAVESKGVDY